MWYGFAARARVLIVNKNQRHPKSIRDLTDPQWHDRCGVAKPLFGTTATHAACLFAAWGDADAKAFFETMPTPEQLMPAITVEEMQHALNSSNGRISGRTQ